MGGAETPHLCLWIMFEFEQWPLSSPERTHGSTKCMSPTMWAMNGSTRFSHDALVAVQCTVYQEEAAASNRRNEWFVIQTNDLSFDLNDDHSIWMTIIRFEWRSFDLNDDHSIWMSIIRFEWASFDLNEHHWSEWFVIQTHFEWQHRYILSVIAWHSVCIPYTIFFSIYIFNSHSCNFQMTNNVVSVE